MTSFSECVSLAESAGFGPDTAAQACHILQSESGIGANQACACQACCDSTCTSACGPVYHDAECDARRLTKHCGVLQLDVSNPAFQPVLSSGCGYDVACSLRALFDLSKGGSCFAHPNPWGPDTAAGAYGTCMGSVSAATLASSPGGGPPVGTVNTLQQGGNKDCTLDPATWMDCNINIGGNQADPLGPFAAAGGIGGFFAALMNGKTWEKAGIVLAGLLALGIGLSALVRR